MEQEYALWQQRFGAQPQELYWPGYRGEATLGFRDEIRALEITSRSPRLLSLGSPGSGKRILSVGLSQPVWTGGCGVFFDYQEVIVDGRVEAQFESIVLVAAEDASRKMTLRARRELSRISPADGTIYARLELGEEVVPWPQADVFSRLEVTLENGAIKSLRWAGNDLPSLLARSVPTERAGTWGLIHEHGSSWFHDPRRLSFDSKSRRTP